MRGGERGISAHVFDLATSNQARAERGVLSFPISRPTTRPLPGGYGFLIPTAVDASSEPAAPAAARDYALAFEQTRVQVSSAQLSAGVLLGRDQRCLRTPLLDEHDGVSRVHALVVELGGVPVIADAGSTNGVLVNGSACDARVLVPGDVVDLGHRRFTWSANGPGVPTRYERLLPAGTDEQLALLAGLRGPERGEALSVFADWLSERGSAWGEWIRASHDGHTELATALADELACHLRGPLAVLYGSALSEAELANLRFD